MRERIGEWIVKILLCITAIFWLWIIIATAFDTKSVNSTIPSKVESTNWVYYF